MLVQFKVMCAETAGNSLAVILLVWADGAGIQWAKITKTVPALSGRERRVHWAYWYCEHPGEMPTISLVCFSDAASGSRFRKGLCDMKGMLWTSLWLPRESGEREELGNGSTYYRGHREGTGSKDKKCVGWRGPHGSRPNAVSPESTHVKWRPKASQHSNMEKHSCLKQWGRSS